MRATAFADRTRDPGIYRVLRRVTLAVIAVWVPLALWSGFRAIVQVFSLELSPPGAFDAGATVRADVVLSGRTHADLSLDLVQDGRTIPIATRFVAGGFDGALDPRPKRGSLVATLTPAHLEGWKPGPVTLRATAVGRHQWFRLPPPTVREILIPR